MKKNLKLTVFSVVLCAVSALNVKMVLDTEHFGDLSLISLAAIGEGNPGEGGSSGGNSGENGSGGGNSGEGGGILDWWNRKDYNCETVECVYFNFITYATKAVRVADGTGTVAHAWNCPACEDIYNK